MSVASTVGHTAQVLERAFGPGWHGRREQPLALDDESEPEPDIAMVPGTPLDRRFKHALYARAAIADYWIVNIVDTVLDVRRDPAPAEGVPLGAIYRQIEILRPPDFVTPLAAPAARIAVADLLPPAR